MKSILLVLLYIATFMLFFFVFSAIGSLWMPFGQVITSVDWFMVYTIFFGSWLGALPVVECCKRWPHYFKEVL